MTVNDLIRCFDGLVNVKVIDYDGESCADFLRNEWEDQIPTMNEGYSLEYLMGDCDVAEWEFNPLGIPTLVIKVRGMGLFEE